MKRIICVGNRYAPGDAAGPAVYDRLSRSALPRGVEVIDGGLAGLDLLRFIEGAERVVFVDSVSGVGRPHEVLVLDPADVAATTGVAYDHSAGLAYLLRALAAVCEASVPEMHIVGVEGPPNGRAIEEAATLALKMALDGALSGVVR